MKLVTGRLGPFWCVGKQGLTTGSSRKADQANNNSALVQWLWLPHVQFFPSSRFDSCAHFPTACGEAWLPKNPKALASIVKPMLKPLTEPPQKLY